MLDFLKRKKKTDQENIEDQVLLGANAVNLSRHSDAAQEFIKAYTGYDGNTNQTLKKSLSGIAANKLNDGQKGYAAEVLDVAKRNAEEKLKGSDIRYSRVDDLPGHTVNETPYDIMAVTPDGKELKSLGSQMKFNKGAENSIASKLVSEEYRKKYPHAQYSVPADRYDGIKLQLENKEKGLVKQLERASMQGNTELEETLNERLDYVKKAKNNLVKSKLTLSESEDAVINPRGMTASDIKKLGHEAGVNYATTAALIKGTTTFARCIDKVIRGEMSPGEAATEVAAETVKSAGVGYLTGHVNTALASLMKNSSKEVLKELGNSSAPAQIVTFATGVFRIVNDRMEGKITDEECFHNIAKSGVGVVGTFQAGVWGEAVGAKIGEKIGSAVGGTIGGPVGAIAVSMVAGIIINTTYDYAVETLKAPGIARQERIAIEQECRILHKELERVREEFRSTYVENTNQLIDIFGASLKEMALALKMNDANAFIEGANTVTKALGGDTQFETLDEFERFLESDEVFIL